ncbi:conserved hypothetical protein [Gluconacetobacter diazotrophicus PA1 5]|uniref:phage adaptor protein n=1 Tax=Gluconacetobacter diazotrophicus TaxID=33996 RepID=UPI000173D6D9|nr:hypothetical protein [Gluconacetobacter diazotrophicus]ACI52199.1 conserved hypothetical protein [Gluconacetobacter diazotrophicus PA1 5]TWB00428.1 hypothetical protein FBZ86_1368 [Gluconacetobacter diazotrophicus]
MTTSGTATWNPSASAIINGALRLIGAIASGETPPANEYEDAMMALNGLIKSWQVSGVHVWAQTEGTLFLQPGQAQYAIGVNSPDHATGAAGITASTALAATGVAQIALASVSGIVAGSQIGIVLDSGPVFWSSVASVSGTMVYLASALPSQASAGAVVASYSAPFVRPLKVIGARLVNPTTGVETPLIPMSRLDYANLSGKTAPPGAPAQYFYDPQLGSGIFSVFPAPADGSTLIRFTCQRPLQDFGSQADTADVPQEWSSALRFALAVELGPEYDCPQARMEMLKGMADEKFAVVSKWDVEPEGTTTYPFSQSLYQMIAGALRLCGAVGPQDVPRLGLIENAFTALNAMVQAWQASGIHVWAEEDCTLFLQPGQVRYLLGSTSPDQATVSSQWSEATLAATALSSASDVVLSSASGVAVGSQIGIWLGAGRTFWTTVTALSGTTATLTAALPAQASAGARVVSYATPLIRPLRVPGARRYHFAPPDGQAIEIPVVPMSRLDYAAVPNKTTPGTVTQFFYDPQLGNGVIHVWPAPSDNRNALKFTAQRPLTTFATLTSAPDFPDEWLAAMRWNLAVEMWPEFNGSNNPRGNPAQYALLKEEARSKLMVAQGWDREPQSVLFGAGVGPAGRSG